MNREMLFAKTLEQVRKTAREQGNCISEEQVREAFSSLALDEGQLELVFDYLTKHKVGIGAPPDPDEDLTDKEKNYLQNYLDQLELLPVYSPGEKQAYTLSAMAGEADAKKKVIEMHLGEVVDIARLYTGQGAALEDLIGEGNIALTVGAAMLGSLEHVGEADGMLARQIMDAMEEYIRENADQTKVDKRARDKVNKVFDRAKALSEELGRKVTVEELAEDTGLSDKEIRDALRISGFQIEYIADQTAGGSV
ncbi:MAG: hypothetical protein NC417_03930 [Candidatus Gastranaerophilales bacterium]|nr:hypothetical protein [Candidatus Gastranaerophilales bacterium]